MVNVFSSFLRREPLTVTFALAVVLLLGTVTVQDLSLEARSLPGRTVTAASSSINPREAAKLARLKRESDRKMTTMLKTAQKRLTPRYLRTSTGANVSNGKQLSSSSRSVKYEKAKCGDGLVISPERCDDGNTQDKDGCSKACLKETGFYCTTGQPSYCWDQCGDGVVSSNEKCDDGNGTVNDGCDDGCRIEPGYTCSGAPSACVHP